MLRNKQIIKFHETLCGIYKKTYGDSVSGLDNWSIKYTDVIEHPDLMKILEKSSSSSEVDFAIALERVFDDLVKLKYLTQQPDTSFMLTPEGHKYGNRGLGMKFVNYFNLNPGLQTLVSIASLIMAFSALVVSIKKS